MNYKYLFIVCSSFFIFSLYVPVFSTTNETGNSTHQNLFSDLSRNMTLQDFQKNNDSSNTNPDAISQNNDSNTNPDASSQNNDSNKVSN
ncbi:MAG: hypothetical protein WA393_04605 [Nitrososphaeraceae archaeon]